MNNKNKLIFNKKIYNYKNKLMIVKWINKKYNNNL